MARGLDPRHDPRPDDRADGTGGLPGGVLVVGAEGMIGSALVDHLARTGRSVIRTTRRGGGGSLPLDLAAQPSGWRVPGGVSVAYLCAAITSLEACRDNAAAAGAVNVEGTAWLAHQLVAAGVRVVFPSTNLVFDGSSPLRRPDEPACPGTAYGRMKAEAERRLLVHGERACVLRLTKVIGPGMPLVARWAGSLADGLPIHPFFDMVMAPVTLPMAVDALDRIGRGGAGGIFQLSASRDVSYAEVARHLADRLGADGGLVQPVPAATAGIPAEQVVAHTTLDVGRLKAEFGLSPPDPWEAIDWVIDGMLTEAIRP